MDNIVDENNFEKWSAYWQRPIKGKNFEMLKETQSQNQPNFVELPVPIDSLINKPTFRTDMVIHVGNNVLEISNTVSENLLSMVLKVM